MGNSCFVTSFTKPGEKEALSIQSTHWPSTYFEVVCKRVIFFFSWPKTILKKSCGIYRCWTSIGMLIANGNAFINWCASVYSVTKAINWIVKINHHSFFWITCFLQIGIKYDIVVSWRNRECCKILYYLLCRCNKRLEIHHCILLDYNHGDFVCPSLRFSCYLVGHRPILSAQGW